MTRKAAWCGLSFLAGTLLFCTLGESFLVLTLAAAALTVLAFLALSEYRVYAAAVGVSVLCGLFCGRAYAFFHIAPALELAGKEITVEGEITECRELGGESYVLTVDGEAEGRDIKLMFYTDRPCELYSIVRVSGEAELLEDTASFPAKSYYLSKGIYLKASGGSPEETGEYGSPIMRGITSLRDYTAKCISASMDKESAAFVTALVCGDRTELGDAAKTRLYRAGVGHILAMSGMHIGVVAVTFGSLLSLVIRSKRIRLIILEVIILMFMVFGGLSPSIVRAGIMISLVYCSQLFGRQTDILSSLGICAVVMCGPDPYICISQSFICSFTACFAVGAVAPKLTSQLKGRRFSFITVPVITSAAVIAVMMPVMALWFDEFSVIAPISNLLTVPLCSAALMLSLLAMLLGGTVLPAEMLFRWAGLLIKLVLKLTDFFVSLGAASVGCRRYILILTAAAAVNAALVYAIRFRRVRVFGFTVTAAFVMLWAVQALSNLFYRSEVRVKLFSGGRSLCAVISNGGSCSVIDLGAKGGFHYGVQQYLSYNGIRRCDTVFIADGAGADSYRSEIFPAFESISTDLGYYGSAFTEGMTADFGAYTVTRTAGGYELSAEGGSLVLTKKNVSLGGEELSAEELKGYPEIIL